MKIAEEIITSRQNPLIKRTASLADGKGRRAESAFIAEGEKLTREAAAAGLPVTHVFVAESRKADVFPSLLAAFSGEKYADTALITVSDGVYEKISTESSPRGVSCVIKYLDFFSVMDIIDKEDFFRLAGERVLALSSVRDPGNLGSVIRSAVAFGVDRLILSGDCADIYSPKVVRSAMGSLFRVRITVVRDMASFVSAASAVGRRVLAAELRPGALALTDAALTKDDIILIGNEGHGIDPALSALCSGSVYIPISAKTESLNASVAAAVFMFVQGQM